MIRRPPKKPVPIPIHSRLEPDDHKRLAILADQQNSSVARIVKLAIIEYLDRACARPVVDPTEAQSGEQ
jgi:predicted HicB family RNase H-like nuclease